MHVTIIGNGEIVAEGNILAGERAAPCQVPIYQMF